MALITTSAKSLLRAAAAVAATVVALQSTVEATLCSPGQNSKYVGLKAPLKQVKSYHESPRNKFMISGTVEIVDGCKFIVRDFVFPSGLSATWYGKDLNENEGYRVIQGIVAPSSGEDRLFTLSDSPGNSYDWSDFDTLTVFYKDSVYAEAHFPELEPGSNYNPKSHSSTTSGKLVKTSQSEPGSSRPHGGSEGGQSKEGGEKKKSGSGKGSDSYPGEGESMRKPSQSKNQAQEERVGPTSAGLRSFSLSTLSMGFVAASTGSLLLSSLGGGYFLL